MDAAASTSIAAGSVLGARVPGDESAGEGVIGSVPGCRYPSGLKGQQRKG